MIKGTLQKIETLGDGSIKLSVYADKELLNQVVPMSYQRVFVSLQPMETMESGEVDVLALRAQLERVLTLALDVVRSENKEGKEEKNE